MQKGSGVTSAAAKDQIWTVCFRAITASIKHSIVKQNSEVSDVQNPDLKKKTYWAFSSPFNLAVALDTA